MGDFINTALTCNKENKLKEIVNKTESYGDSFGSCTIINGFEDGKLRLGTFNGTPDIIGLSKKYPKIRFTCEHSFDSDWNSVLHVYEYKNGKDKFIKKVSVRSSLRKDEQLNP